jgi:hypothetical protein
VMSLVDRPGKRSPRVAAATTGAFGLFSGLAGIAYIRVSFDVTLSSPCRHNGKLYGTDVIDDVE